jgi:ribosome recycling factor
MDLLSLYQEEFVNVIIHFKEELSGLRTGRANAAMVENIVVEAYGGKMALKGVASITIPDSRSIVIEPWDKTLMKDVEDGIRNAGKNLNPVNEGAFLRVPIPALTEESRRELVKIIGQKAEETKIRIRKVREDIKNDVLTAEEANEITEDERFKMQDQLDKKTADLNLNIKEMAEEKEAEIMKI